MTNAITLGRDVLQTEAAALSTLADGLSADTDLGRAFSALCAAVQALPGRVIVSGMGKSGHVARKIAATLASTGTKASFVHPAEASHGDLGMIGTDDLVLALSNSGETRELSDLIQYCARFSIPLAVMTSGDGSSLAKAADYLLLLPNVGEACAVTRAPTTSTTLMMALGDALAVALLKQRGFDADDFRTFHPGGKLGAAFRKVGDVARPRASLPICAPDTPMTEVIALISEHGAGAAGMVDQSGTLVGIITDGDLRRNFHRDLSGLTAVDIMSADPVTVDEDVLAADALGLLNRSAVQMLFITKDKRPTGLLHVHDFLRQGVM